MSVTAQEVQNALTSAYKESLPSTMNAYVVFEEALDDIREDYKSRVTTDLGVIEIVDQERGDWNIDDEQQIFMVFHLNGQYFRADGTYSSWEDAQWSGDLYEVERVPVPQYTYKAI